MAEHPNVEVARKGLDAFLKGDVDTLAATISDDIVWHAPGSNAFSGDFHGKAAVMQRMADQRAAGVTITFAIHDIVGNDEHVVALVDTTISRSDGRSATTRGAQIYHVRDGQMTEFWLFNEDQAAVDAMLSA